MADKITGGGGISDLASTAALLAPLLIGSGTKKGTETTTASSSPDLIALLRGLVGTSADNATNPAATQGTVDDIIRQAQVAFTPVLGAAGRSGLYNSSTVGSLASESIANATKAASQAVLNYRTNQQQIAVGGASNLLNANRSTTTSSSGATSPAIPPAVLGGGLAALQLYAKSDKLKDLLGFGSNSSPGTVSFSGLGDGTTDITGLGDGLISNFPSTISSLSSSAPTNTVIGDGGGLDLAGLLGSGSGGGIGDTASIGGSILDTLTSAGNAVADTASQAGSAIADEGSSVLDSITKLFGF